MVVLGRLEATDAGDRSIILQIAVTESVLWSSTVNQLGDSLLYAVGGVGKWIPALRVP